MSDRWDRVLSGLLTIAAITMAIVVVRREFFPSALAEPRARSPDLVPDWSEFLSSGYIVGDSAAPVKIIEFSDLECPFCKTFHATVRAIRKDLPNDIAFVFVHFPLPNHRFARPAARALECARIESKFVEMLDYLYEKQDSFGLKPWSAYAHDIGISNARRFGLCASDTVRVPAIEAGVALGERLGLHTTPTILVNGWRYVGGLDQAQLAAVIKELLAGRHP
jgi:protein-disulfide isomerase